MLNPDYCLPRYMKPWEGRSTGNKEPEKGVAENRDDVLCGFGVGFVRLPGSIGELERQRLRLQHI